jgi:hypothetical protein
MRRALSIVAVCAAMTFAATASADPVKDEQKMCEKVAGVKFAFAHFEGLTKSATVEQTEKAADLVADSFKELRKAAEKVRPIETKQVVQAAEGLRKALHDAPDDATLADVEANVAARRAEFMQSFKAFEQTVSCPGQVGAGGQYPRPAP